MQEPEEVQLVRALADNPASSVDYEHKFKGLEEQLLRRKARHDAAFQQYQKQLAELSEALEEQVLSCSRIVRESLAENDASIEKLAAQMRDDAFLLTLNLGDVKQLRVEAEQNIVRRQQVVQRFEDSLENIEMTRSRTVEVRLKDLTEELTAIAHKLRGDIEEIVAEEVFELNSVMTANRKTYAELTTIMKKQVVEKRTTIIAEWDVCMQRWRTLMHNQELERVLASYNGAEMTDPPARSSYLQDVQGTRMQMLEQREGLMAKLSKADMSVLTSDEVISVLAEFESLHATELGRIREWYEGLTLIREQVQEAMLTAREKLRKQLHYYGALKPEPPLSEHAEQLQSFIGDEQLAELYRKAGALKPELAQLAHELRDPDIAYRTVLEAAQARARTICAGFDLVAVLEQQGKGSVREVLRAHNDKIRGTPKTEVLSMLPVLKKQINDLAQVQDIDESCRELLLECANDVNIVITTAEDLRTVDDDTRTTGRTTTGRSKLVSTAGTSRTRRSRRTPRASLTETATTEEDGRLVIDMVTLRTTQKKLGMIIMVGELPDNAKQEVAAIASALVQQEGCNVVVDQVVAEHCDPAIRETSQNQKAVIEALILSLERHAEYWMTVGSRLCVFYSRLAKIRETHEVVSKTIDDENHDMMAILEFNYEQEVQRLEDLLASCSKQISHAVNDAQLEREFERALRLLEQLEHFYHHYHSIACFAADIQPVATTKAAHQLLKSLCDAFHLAPATEHDILHRYRHTKAEARRLNAAFLQGDERSVEDINDTDDPNTNVSTGVHSVEVHVEEEHEVRLPDHTDAERYRELNPPVKSMNEWLAVDHSLYTDTALEELCSTAAPDMMFSVPVVEAETEMKYGILMPFADTSMRLLSMDQLGEAQIPVAEGQQGEENADEAATKPRTFEEFYSELRQETHAAVPEFETGGCIWWNKGFRLLSDEELQDAPIPDILALLADAFQILHEREFQELSIPEQRAYTIAKLFVQAIHDRHFSENPPTLHEERLAVHLRFPVRQDGEPFLPQIIPSAAELTQMLTHAATGFLTFAQLNSSTLNHAAVTLSEKRKKRLTDQLEESTRTHWPRRGEIETTLVHQREAELIAHHQRLARHQQLVKSKAASMESNFQQLLTDARARCDEFVRALAGIRSKLNDQDSLAGVQGVELRGKKLHDEFQADCAARNIIVSAFVNDEPGRLKTTNHEILRSCKSFEQGGDYSEAELETVRNVLQALDELIQSAATARTQFITDLHEQQQQTAAGINDFWAQCKQVGQDLALSEGLGQKYGASRRTAQERIRTEVTRDESAAGRIDEWLASLEFECSEAEWYLNIYDDEQKGHTQEKLKRLSAKNAARARHQSVRNVLVQIRAAVRHRFQYLGLDAGTVRSSAHDAPVVWVEGVAEPPGIAHPFDVAPKPFAATIQEVQEECKTNTVQLYKVEGKLDLITHGSQTQLPEALLRWLEEMSTRLLGPKGHKDRSSERLWSQVARLDRMWGREFRTMGVTISAVCFRDIFLACSAAFKSSAERLEKQFSKTLKAWELGRQKHERVLRPQLSTPEGADELAALCAAESERSAELYQGIIACRRDLLSAQFQRAQQFLIDVHNVTVGLLQLMDSTVSVEFQQQQQQQQHEHEHEQQQRQQEEEQSPGEDAQAHTTRKSYKRLRKVQRLKQEALQAREPASTSGPKKGSATAPTTTAGAEAVGERKRTWPSLELAPFVTATQEADTACHAHGSAASNPPESATPVPQSSFQQQYATWVNEIVESSRLVSAVTPAHRTLFRERDLACDAFLQEVLEFTRQTAAKYAELLQQERNWQERWNRQLELLSSNDVM